MCCSFIRRSPGYVNSTTVCFPAGNARSKMLVGICDATVMLFFKSVLWRIGIRIAPLPERLDELLALFIRLQMNERVPLLRRNDVDNVLVQPLLILGIELFEELLIALTFGLALLAAGLVLLLVGRTLLIL